MKSVQTVAVQLSQFSTDTYIYAYRDILLNPTPDVINPSKNNDLLGLNGSDLLAFKFFPFIEFRESFVYAPLYTHFFFP